MRTIDIELWVHRVIDQVKSGQHSEDGLVELKARWPAPADAARRIAAHANAAGGATILWIIGIDEERGVCGADPLELADWFPSVCRLFDDAHPDLTDVNVRIGDLTVVALLFTTDRAPFMVRGTAARGGAQGAIDWEVPWREGRRTRTARRHELLRLLAAATTVPEVEDISCELRLCEEWTESGSQAHRWYLRGDLYVLPRQGTSVVFPFHHIGLSVALDSGAVIESWTGVRLMTPSLAIPGSPVFTTGSEAIITGPGMLNFHGSALASSGLFAGATAVCRLALRAVGALSDTVSITTLAQVDKGEDSIAKWRRRVEG